MMLKTGGRVGCIHVGIDADGTVVGAMTVLGLGQRLDVTMRAFSIQVTGGAIVWHWIR